MKKVTLTSLQNENIAVLPEREALGAWKVNLKASNTASAVQLFTKNSHNGAVAVQTVVIGG